MKRLLHFINSNSIARDITFHLVSGISRLIGVPSFIIARAETVNSIKDVEYSTGLLFWFISFRLKFFLPTYNIYHLFESDEDISRVSFLLSQRLDEYKVSKQYHLIRNTSVYDYEFKSYIQQLLDKCLSDRRKPLSQKQGHLNIEKAFDCLRGTTDILAGNDIRAFLISGTLLGFIREGHLLEYDNDLDLGVFADETSKETLVYTLRESNTFAAIYDLGDMVQATHKNGTIIDIFLHYIEEDKLWHGTDIHRWENTPFSLVEKEFLGRLFYIPDNPERYLEENYGNWTKRALFWNYSFDTPNQNFTSSKKTVFFLLECILNELARKKPDRHNVENCIRALSRIINIESGPIYTIMPEPAMESEKEKIVITFGTFDLFHIGHLNILSRAAGYGNKLIVGVSSDALNYSKKKAYPVYNQEDRMRIVNAIEYVDDVFLEESLELKRQYISRYNADVLIMGDDWKGKFDEMCDICEVVYLSRTKNISTSETKDSIRVST